MKRFSFNALSITSILTVLLSFFVYADEVDNKTTNLKFIYVHGFGERRFPPSFEVQMKEFLKSINNNSQIETYRWDSLELDLTKVAAQWNQAKHNADNEAKVFSENILKKYESKKTKYVLIGYSLGSRVIAESLKHYNGKLNHLSGIFFIGSALPKNYVVNKEVLPEGFKIINYFSNFLDYVLKISFYNAEGIKAGGEIGFDDQEHFENYRTVCTHVHKGGPIQRDYSNLARAIGYISFFKENIFIKGEGTKFNIEIPVNNGIANWNDIYQFNSNSETILIQQNVNTNHYRAALIKKDKTRIRKAWGNNLHSILKKLKLF